MYKMLQKIYEERGKKPVNLFDFLLLLMEYWWTMIIIIFNLLEQMKLRANWNFKTCMTMFDFSHILIAPFNSRLLKLYVQNNMFN